MTLPLIPVLAAVLFISPLTACMVGPDYQRPKLDIALEFKEVKGWKPAQPMDELISSDWWTVFNDPQLNSLEVQVSTTNQSLKQSEAQYRQAQYLVQSAQSSLLPIFNVTSSLNRFRASTGQSIAVSGVRNLVNTAEGISWVPDLWGGVRRQIESNSAAAQASAATMQALRLSLQASLADTYFQLQSLDVQQQVLNDNIGIYQKTLSITQNRYAVGVAAKSDVVQAESQLQGLRAQSLNLGVQRAKLEHAIAVLVGKAPASLSLKTSASLGQAPALPKVLPSALLERRPDIAAAERNVAAANAKIGVAKAAYYPTLNLAANNGFQSSGFDSLFNSAQRYWALGPASLALTVFDGGVKNAQYKQAIAAFDASVAAYKQTVLTGFQEVEDQLSTLRILAEGYAVQAAAVTAANEALSLTLNQYHAGTVSYLNVMTAQTTALNQQQTAIQLLGQRLSAAVLLIKALGGGWDLKKLPSTEQAAGQRRWTDYLILPFD